MSNTIPDAKSKPSWLESLANQPFHSILFAMYMVLAIASTDHSLIFFIEGWRTLLVVPIAVGVVMCALFVWLHNWARSGYLTTLLLFFIFIYGHLRRTLSVYSLGGFSPSNDLFLLPLWTIIIGILASSWIWRRITQPTLITRVLNLIAVIALLLPGFTVVRIMYQLANDPLNTWEPVPVSIPTLSAQQKPDIYYIILDGYGSENILFDLYGYDNGDFINELESMDFYVAKQSHSNYMRTSLSLSSSLNFTYLDALSSAGTETANWFPLIDLIAHSQIRQVLASQGYTFISYSTGFFYTEIADADIYLSPHRVQLNNFEQLFVGVSALELLTRNRWLDLPSFSYSAHRRQVLFTFDSLANLPQTAGLSDSPKFIFAHIVIPHPPFVFDSTGQPIESTRAYNMADASDFDGTITEYLTGYREQLAYANNLILATIEAIQAESENQPVIIIQGDHGPGAYLQWNDPHASCLQERLSILNAYYLPGVNDTGLYPSISPVNTFRVILNTYFNASLPLLDDRSYASNNFQPYRFEDVTSASLQPCNNLVPPTK